MGFISAAKARDVYGVVPAEIAKETADRRQQLRNARLARASRAGMNSDTGLRPGTLLSRFGSGLLLTQAGDARLQFECECGQVFCRAEDNWKNYAASNRIEGNALPRTIKVHETLELVEYFCPACGIQHAVDVTEKDHAILHDLKITKWI